MTKCKKTIDGIEFPGGRQEAIGRTTGLPQEMVDYALEELAKPDGRSRSFEEEGRRIVLLCPDERTWGWRLVNYAKYRDIVAFSLDAMGNKGVKGRL